MVTIDAKLVRFSSGKIRGAFSGVVGLMRHSDGSVSVTEGYDGILWADRESEAEAHEDEPGDPSLSGADLVELAAFMQEQWRKFGESVKGEASW